MEIQNAAREIVRYSTRALYIKAQDNAPSAYLYLPDIQELIRAGVDFTFHDTTEEWTEEQLHVRVILNNENHSHCKDVQLLNRIIRAGSARCYIEKLEKEFDIRNL